MDNKQLDWLEEELRKAWEEDPEGMVAAYEWLEESKKDGSLLHLFVNIEDL